MHNFTNFANTLIAALLLATASTLADLIWALWVPEHRAIYGLIHGALLFMTLGLVLAVLAARDRDVSDCRRLLTLAAIGELLAGLGGPLDLDRLFESLDPRLHRASLGDFWPGYCGRTPFRNGVLLSRLSDLARRTNQESRLRAELRVLVRRLPTRFCLPFAAKEANRWHRAHRRNRLLIN